MDSTRTAWGDFPPVVRNGLSALSREAEYIAAKEGDPEAALALVTRLMSDEMVAQVRELIGDDPDARIVPIQAEESSGRNKIPLAVAEVLAFHLNLQVEYDICQVTRVHRTGASADHRLAFCPKFQGNVEPGRSYVIVDDTMTMGGTLAELRGYITSQGGKVAGAAVMAAREGAVSLPVTEKMLKAIDTKHGEKLNEYWKKEFGHGLDKLTQHEAGHLRAAVSFDTIRDRISAARNAARWSVDEKAAGSEKTVHSERDTDPPPLTVVGFSEYRAGQISRAEAFFTKAQDAFWLSSERLLSIRSDIENRADSLGVPPSEALKVFRDAPGFEDLAQRTIQAVAESGLAQAAHKRLMLTQRRLDRQYEWQPSDAEIDRQNDQGLDYP